MIRPFVLRDLLVLHRLRHQGLFLDTTTALTWGPTIVPAGALLTHLAPATGIFTFLGVADHEDEAMVLTQIVHHGDSACARFSFLAPETALDSATFLELVDHLSAQVGERGAHHLVAEVDEQTAAYEVLRRAGFAIYARQRVWSLPEDRLAAQSGSTPWRSAEEADELPVRILYNAIVPGLTQQVEDAPWERLRGLVYQAGDELLAYVGLTYGPRGVMVHPFFHPDTERIADRLMDMLAHIANRRSRQVYVTVRSYQGWLEAALESIGAQPGVRQAVMVKRLAVTVQKPVVKPLPSLKGTTANPTTPFAHSIRIQPPNGKPVEEGQSDAGFLPSGPLEKAVGTPAGR